MSEQKVIRIKQFILPQTGLLMATSDDLPGLVVHARSDDELIENLLVVIKDLLEASGFRLESVAPIESRSSKFEERGAMTFIARTDLKAA